MNKLIGISFRKMGYDYGFLTGMSTVEYGGNHLFLDEDRICLALRDARNRKERVTVMPDFDMDGISAGCVLYAGLSLLGFRVSLYKPVPNNGYGIKISDVDAVLRAWPDTKVILTCDVGVAAAEAAPYAATWGVRFLVTDHHVEKPGKRIDAASIMDPCRYDEPAGFKGVCGAWVAWHLVTTYAKLSGTSLQQELVRKLALFVGLGSCGDLMPMVHDTRKAVQESVAEFRALMAADTLSDYFGCDEGMLPEAYVAPFDNMRALHGFLADSGKADKKDITDEDYSFLYCPMFNSVRRLGQTMDNVYEMLYRKHVWNSMDRLTLFRWLLDLNDTRKSMVAQLYGQLKEHKGSQPFAPYVYFIDAVPGILGLLAAKLMDLNGCPCLVVRPDPEAGGFSGSGRVPGWMDKGDMLAMDGVTFDGHDNAFGVFIQAGPDDAGTAARVKAVCGAMAAKYASELSRRGSESSGGGDRRTVICVGGHPECGSCDFALNCPDDMDVCYDYVLELNRFRPFGREFPEPVLVLKFLRSDVIGFRKMGSGNTHVRLTFDTNFQAVWFGGADAIDRLGLENAAPGTVFALEGKLGLNTFNGSTSLQFQVSGLA